ncbi:MAG TPA: ATP-binding protein [Phycisphaerae bacterium]|nr:ATP-binding protein [Phycisphaerae bacterium]
MTDHQLSGSTDAALRERVKELTCLYGIAQIAARPAMSLEEILPGIVGILPPAWQYPGVTHARIVLDGRTYASPGFREGSQRLAAEIVVGGVRRGSVHVFYTEEKPECDDGPFLKEERSLLNAVARQVALILEHGETEEDRLKLRDQLRHADRLATIGLLAAGVAHELNEPLGNILGFAQLAKKCQGLPPQAKADMAKIEAASLHAREVIKNLLVFARQMSPQKTQVDLNSVVEESLYFLESRCAEQGIESVCCLAPNLPAIHADPGQLNQVLVNLVVNALHAMPMGGELTVRTESRDDLILLIVEDTGIGMGEETIDEIFIPFFTTKDIGQGTGLGLAVVHGIVTSHGGSIKVQSKEGQGSRFEIEFPAARPRRVTAKG